MALPVRKNTDSTSGVRIWKGFPHDLMGIMGIKKFNDHGSLVIFGYQLPATTSLGEKFPHSMGTRRLIYKWSLPKDNHLNPTLVSTHSHMCNGQDMVQSSCGMGVNLSYSIFTPASRRRAMMNKETHPYKLAYSYLFAASAHLPR